MSSGTFIGQRLNPASDERANDRDRAMSSSDPGGRDAVDGVRDSSEQLTQRQRGSTRQANRARHQHATRGQYTKSMSTCWSGVDGQ